MRAIRAAHIAVVGLGGVGSWAAEALARSGVAALTLVDLDHVAESNVNRQVQALGSTLGMAKVEALAARIADIHPGCAVAAVEEFVDESNWPGLLARRGRRRHRCLRRRARQGGARRLGARRRRRRSSASAPRAASARPSGSRSPTWPTSRTTRCWPRCASACASTTARRARGALGVCCVFSREPVALPAGDACDVDGSLNCHGYGSSVAVTATFGMVAAARALEFAARSAPGRAGASATL